MFAPRRSILLSLVALVAAGFMATPRAHALTLPPDCIIEGAEASCYPELWYGPGPEEEFSYEWTGPNGLTASSRFVDVFDSGVYTLTLMRVADGATSTCSRTFTQLPSDPPCAIAGPDVLCSGQQAELCGPEGPYYTFMWVSPDGYFLGTSRCITVSTPGTYTLTVMAGECQTRCSRDLPQGDCSPPPPPPPPPSPPPPSTPLLNCPRGAGFWSQQCAQRGNGSTEFSAEQLVAIAASVDAHSDLFDWSTAAAGFCAVVDPERPMDPRKQARRQFAAFLANLCAGEAASTMRGGSVVSLDPSTQVSFGGHETTFGALAQSVDARLVELQDVSLDGAGVRDEYGRIADALGAFNDGNGFTVTCPPGEGSFFLRPAPAAKLMIASPNPFSATTTIAYAVGAGESADIAVYDLSGRLVKQIAVNVQGSGAHAFTWDGTDIGGGRVRTGVYFVRGRIGQQTVRAQVLMVR